MKMGFTRRGDRGECVGSIWFHDDNLDFMLGIKRGEGGAAAGCWDVFGEEGEKKEVRGGPILI